MNPEENKIIEAIHALHAILAAHAVLSYPPLSTLLTPHYIPHTLHRFLSFRKHVNDNYGHHHHIE